MPRDGHFINRTNWLRAAVLGANDGIVSTASLLVGVVAAGMDRTGILLAGLAGMSAGAFSMAAGEYVSVSAQADTEAADLERERRALEEDPEYELQELADGFAARGVSPQLAMLVAAEMTEHDALDAHAREELGLNDVGNAVPLQAAWASAVSFAAGASLPLLGAWIAPREIAIAVIAVLTLVALAALGAFGAWLGGAPPLRPTVRVLFWGAVAMAVTAVVGHFSGQAL